MITWKDPLVVATTIMDPEVLQETKNCSTTLMENSTKPWINYTHFRMIGTLKEHVCTFRVPQCLFGKLVVLSFLKGFSALNPAGLYGTKGYRTQDVGFWINFAILGFDLIVASTKNANET